MEMKRVSVSVCVPAKHTREAPDLCLFSLSLQQLGRNISKTIHSYTVATVFLFATMFAQEKDFMKFAAKTDPR